MKRVEVVWYDACDLGGRGWTSNVELKKDFPPDYKGIFSRTRGWLWSMDDDKVVLAMTWASEVTKEEEESMRGIMMIPRGMVVEIIEEEGDANGG